MHRLRRLIPALLLAWVAFLVSSLAYAAVRGRNAPPPPPPDADEIDIVTTFAELRHVSHARSFRGGRVATTFGGGVLDLREATLDPAGATLRVSALFGGGQLLVPDDWNVTKRVVGIGGVGDARPRMERSPDAPHLAVEGVALFGGWGIASHLDPRQERAMDRRASS